MELVTQSQAISRASVNQNTHRSGRQGGMVAPSSELVLDAEVCAICLECSS
jgi:hypothetical protein